MKVDVESVGSFQKRITLTVPPERVSGELDKAYKQLARRVRLRGFRPGKAPRRVLEARFGAQVEADVAQELINVGWRHALDNNELQPVSQPNLSDSGSVKSKNGFSFTITVDVRPEVELSQYTELDVGYPKVEVTSEEVDAAVAARLEGEAKLEEVSGRPVEDGDMALVELTVTDGDDEVAKEMGTMIRTGGDPYYPGIESLVVGAEVGQEVSGEVSFGADARTEAVAGRTLPVTLKVLSIQSYTTPELDDELADKLGFEGGAEGMRTAIEGQIREQRDLLARNQARANLLEELIKANKFDVPTGMIEQSLQMLVEELKMQQAYRTGRDPRTIHFGDAQMADLRIRAEFAAKSALILEYVSKKENIEVTDADLDAKYQELADQRGQTVEAVKGWFTKDDAVGELKDRILEEKTLDWLLERANLVEPSPEAANEGDAELKAVAADMVKEQVEKKAASKKSESKKAAEAAPAADAADAGEADLSILSGSIGALKDALATGDHDAHLDALLAAEESGKARKGALTAIQARMG
jgi:trigger factor